jgi:hypothetical protein
MAFEYKPESHLKSILTIRNNENSYAYYKVLHMSLSLKSMSPGFTSSSRTVASSSPEKNSIFK